MSGMMDAPPPLLAISLTFGAYFTLVIPSYNRATRSTVLFLGLQKRQSWVAASDVVRLGIATAGQATFLALLALAVGAGTMGLGASAPLRILMGGLLGLGEMAASALLVHLVLTTASGLFPGRVPSDVRGWIPYSRGGWMRYYFSTLKRAPVYLQVILTIGYVGVEELLYRGAVIEALRDHGMAVAVGVSSLLFVLGQTICTPGWRTAIFPVLGALVVGPIHGYLFFVVPDIVPLIVAHIVFFYASVL